MDVRLRYEWTRFLSRIHRWRVAAASSGFRSSLAKALRATRPTGLQPHRFHQVDPGSMRNTILFVDGTVPRADRDSGSLRAFNLMKLMVEDGYSVHFLAEDGSSGPPADALRDAGVKICRIPQGSTIPSWFAQHGKDCAAVVVSRHHLACYWIPMARRLSPGALIVFDSVDLHHLREQREADVLGNRALLRASGATRKRELAVIASADISWVVSPAEKDMVGRQLPNAKVIVLPNLHHVASVTPGPEGRSGLLFIGGGRHPPNVDAVKWLLTEIFPRIRQRLPGCTLDIVGEELESRVADVACSKSGITFHGHVPELAGFLQNCRIGLAPLRFGAGVKGKVNQYMAHGLPTIATACATEGMHLEHGTDILIAEDAEAFAAAAAQLLAEQGLWLAISRAGKENVRRHFSFGSARAPVFETFGSAPKQGTGR